MNGAFQNGRFASRFFPLRNWNSVRACCAAPTSAVVGGGPSAENSCAPNVTLATVAGLQWWRRPGDGAEPLRSPVAAASAGTTSRDATSTACWNTHLLTFHGEYQISSFQKFCSRLLRLDDLRVPLFLNCVQTVTSLFSSTNYFKNEEEPTSSFGAGSKTYFLPSFF